MSMKQLRCRDHHGTFSVQPRRGRPPVRCTADNPCTSALYENGLARLASPGVSRSEQIANTIKNKRMAATPDTTESPAKSPATVPPMHNPNLALAKAAKAQLEAVGWKTTGRAWRDENGQYAQLVGSRAEETLIINWQDGKLMNQSYSMWHTKPSRNATPASKLGFNPAEMTDGELVRKITGMKVTWWNALAKSTETAVIPSKVTISHVFVGNGDEDNTKRVVSFVDLNGSGFRSFHVDGLLEIE